jgi:uncharacterized protein (DUF1015 family)
MPELHAFRGLRYDLGHVGALSDVVAPPYDVIDAGLQDRLYKLHPANVVRLILNREEPGDDDADNRYSRAARFLKNWSREGVLASEPDPALYVYHQVFRFGGQEFTRRGFMGRIRLVRFGEGNIYPHEETHAAAKADRLKLTEACKANLSQIFGIYSDPENEAQRILEKDLVGRTPLEATDHLGVVHRLWPVSDVKTISEVAAVMGKKAVYVADGHHRYETACNYRDRLASQQTLDANHPANFVLMMCVSMNDPGMIVLPTHRLFRGLPAISSDDLVRRLGEYFTTEVVGEGPELADSVWERIEFEDDQGMIGLYAAGDGRWVLAQITESGRKRMAKIAPEHSADWQGLGVAILHRLVVGELLEAPELPKPTYVHQVDEVVDGLRTGDEDGTAFPLAALVMPASLDHIQAISEQSERMPAKSTYFYPKLLSGLVINPLY